MANNSCLTDDYYSSISAEILGVLLLGWTRRWVGSRIKSEHHVWAANGLPAKRKIRLEMTDEDGDKVTLIFEGRVTREKLLQLADFVELYGGGEDPERVSLAENKLTRLARVLEKYFPMSSFTSKDALESYVAEYREPITLSTVSTYLARLADRGFLERVAGSQVIKYRILREKAVQLGGE